MRSTTFAVVTLGCKVNQFESEAIAHALAQAGWTETDLGPDADVILINTCVVTGRAEAESRRWIARARRATPQGHVVVLGCYPQIDPETPLHLGADGIIGNQEKESVPDILAEMANNRPLRRVGDIAHAEFPASLPLPRFHHHTRALLKIQDGCNARCTYCVIPLARGRSRSVPPRQVLSSLAELKAWEYREVVLTGIHLGSYGLDLTPPTSLARLLEQIETSMTPGRIRLSSLEPLEATPEIIERMAYSSKLCPHLHLPLQSGNNATLRMMNRPYTSEAFRELVISVNQQIPSVAIGTDILVGFPGEDSRAFTTTYELLQELPLSYLHVFPFSARPGTTAATLTPQVTAREIRERVRLLRALSDAKKGAFYAQFRGHTLPVLIEHRRKDGALRGLSRNYLFCQVKGDDALMGQEVDITISRTSVDRALGRVSESFQPAAAASPPRRPSP